MDFAALFHLDMEKKREWISIDTSKNAKRIDVRGGDGVLVLAIGVNVIFLMILFFFL